MGVRFRLYGCERMRRERMIGECVVSFAALNLELETTMWLALEPRANIAVRYAETVLCIIIHYTNFFPFFNEYLFSVKFICLRSPELSAERQHRFDALDAARRSPRTAFRTGVQRNDGTAFCRSCERKPFQPLRSLQKLGRA